MQAAHTYPIFLEVLPPPPGPSDLKRKAKAFETLSHELLGTSMIFSSTGTAPMDLTKMHCKHYYKILSESYTTEPTGIKTWKINYPNLFTN